jgi:pimeloyl-ACP methyl ester carboxylesterase
MGTAVALETVLLFPEKVGSLILINGFHGQIFKTVFQPLVRVPFMGDAVAALIEVLLANPSVLQLAWTVLSPVFQFLLPIWSKRWLCGSRLMVALSGTLLLLAFFSSSAFVFFVFFAFFWLSLQFFLMMATGDAVERIGC